MMKGSMVTLKRPTKIFKPEDIKFTSLSEFHERPIYPGESPQKLLKIPESGNDPGSQRKFIRGLPRHVYEDIRTSPDVNTTEDAMKWAQLVFRMHEEVAVVGSRISIDRLQAETANIEVSEEHFRSGYQ